MCRLSLAPFLLFLALPLHSEPVYTLTQTQKDAILLRLTSLESNLQELSLRLIESEDLTGSLTRDLQTVSLSLKEARELLQTSEENLGKAQGQLTKAYQTLDSLERQLKDFQKLETVKIVIFSIISCVFGGLVVSFF